jgi:HEAT repeat protein
VSGNSIVCLNLHGASLIRLTGSLAVTFTPMLLLALLALTIWIGVSAVVLAGHLRAERRRSLLETLATRLDGPGTGKASIDERVERVQDVLGGSSKRSILRIAGDETSPGWALEILSTYYLATWDAEELIVQASRHRNDGELRRRVAALRLLNYGRHSSAIELLEAALKETDPEIVRAALSLLGSRSDRRSAGLLIEALSLTTCQPSRVATYLDQFPVPVLQQLRPLLQDRQPTVRFWAATLLGRYAGTPQLDAELAALATDSEATVRKAAVESIGKVGGPAAASMALALLNDPVWFVRAHAARALADLGRLDCASSVAALLSDRQWWVRVAAKEALEAMGPEIWADLVPFLDHPDAFARNGAAEVFQNMGVLDSLVVMEAATDDPSPAKIEMLRKITSAGGVRMTDALLERAGPRMRPRIRSLLEQLGLERAGTV